MPTISPAFDTSSPFASWKADHVAIPVEDLDTATAWYVETLGFRLVRRWSLGNKAFGWLSPAGTDGFIVELLAGSGTDNQPLHEDLGSSLKLSFRTHLGFHVDSIDDAIAELTRRGVTIISEPYDAGEVSRRVAFFVDPRGDLFEAIESISL